jgi:hypothetical protein
VSRRLAAVALCALAPFSLAAADPPDDAVACRGAHGPGDPPDLIAAAGRASEEGSAALWRLTFAEPLQVPDPVDPPFRVDVVIRDPKVPAVSFGAYRDFNRIIRFDATRADARLEMLFIPEGGHTLFDPPVIAGDTMTIEMPGRLLLGADEFGPAAMQRLRWAVVVRDGGRCDGLGDGATTRRLSPGPRASSTPPSPTDQATDTVGLLEGRAAMAIVIAGILVLVSIAVAAIVLRRRR